ncbi:hypothetical protein IVB30_16895 [Bradyrhizobium sp. 200]|uniref:hypothetical protein n=1 Tax=Bradyrhizobium sp. 200 TaxID=2782665 RepID=UPI001FFE8E87|nr:hypothetical protein [Bradyrhizobium sp. 200]UPJ52845.1 hypothetical protein IVB30_16895 [Bradyrhizobium sp. 200]
MSFIRANDHPNADNPDDPLYYAPRSARSGANPRSNATPQARSDHFPPDPPLSRFDEMREEAFAKSVRPLESQFAYERGRPRGLLATAGAIAVALGVTVILALVLFNAFPRSKSDPSELAVSISTPALATPAPVTSDDSQALLQRFQQFHGSENPEHAVSEPASAGTAKDGPEKSQALLDKFMQWQQRK